MPMRRASLTLWAVGVAAISLLFVTAIPGSDALAQSSAKPDQVLVFDFAVSPDDVDLNHGMLARLRGLVDKTPRTQQEKQVGQAVAEALAKKLVADLRAKGLPAVHAGSVEQSRKRPLLVKGQFLSIDEGNRAARVIIGLGAGRSDIQVQVQLYQVLHGDKKLVDRLRAEAKSGRKPGMAEMAGIGGLLGHVLVSSAVSGGLSAASEKFRANVDALAETLAGKIADQILAFYKRRGWT